MAVLKDLIVHGTSRFLNGSRFNTINAESIGAEQGIFNKLIATTLDAKEATIDNLTAQNATVVGLLDVQGELHTNAWTNANIANIGGSFYISPTVEPTDGTTTISITRVSATSWTVSATGTFATDFIKSGTATSGVTWPANSLVLITGDIIIGDMVYPLGTLKGTLNAAVTATAASTSKTITITGVTDAQNNNAPSVLQELYEINSSTNISNAPFKKGKISLYKLGSNPIGILMTSMGTSSNSLMDIYGGVSTNPSVRIGHLAGLPNINGSAPTGWGIYTDNGYFSGVVVSNSGKIANFTINGSKLYSNGHDTYNKAVTGIYIGDDYISFGSGGVTYFNTSGTGKIGPWTLSTTYFRNGNIANATNTSVSGVYLGTDGLNISNGTVATTSYITKSAVNIGNKLTWNGSVLKVDGEITASKLSISSGATIGGDGASQILNSEIEIGGRNLLLDSEMMAMKWYKGSSTTISNGVATLQGSSSNWNSTLWSSKYDISIYDGVTNYIWSFDYKSSADCLIVPVIASTYKSIDSGSWDRTKFINWTSQFTLPNTNGEWKRYVFNSRTIATTDLTSGSGNMVSGFLQIYNRTDNVALDIRHFKLEKGNKATDWTPAPEDVAVDISDAAKTATNCITEISNAGIWVTPSGKKPDANGNPIVNETTGTTGTLINTSGVGIYRNGINVAQYGNTITLGQETSGSFRTKIDSDTFWITNGTIDIAYIGNGNEITDTFVSDGTTMEYELSSTYSSGGVFSPSTVSGTKKSGENKIVISSGLPEEGRIFTYTYMPSDPVTYYTMGYRTNDSAVGIYSFVEGHSNIASGKYSHAEGWVNTASGLASHAEGSSNTASGKYSHAEGGGAVQASGDYSHAEGNHTEAKGKYSHAEGTSTEASGIASHAEGYNTEASGLYSHTEGIDSIANSRAAHAEGYHTTASGEYSHAEACHTTASGDFSHAQNYYTIAQGAYQTVIGKYNTPQGSSSFSTSDYAFIIGNGTGTSDENRSNALTVDWNGGLTTSASIWAKRTSSEVQIGVDGGGGRIYMYSTPTNNRLGIYAYNAQNEAVDVLTIDNDQHIYIGAGTVPLQLYNGNSTNKIFMATRDNNVHLGATSYRWKAVYAINGTIQTSDLKYKSIINNFDWKIDDFIKGLKPIAYKWIDEEDGSLSKRIRFGFGAQDIAKLSKKLNIGDLSLYEASIIEEDKNGMKIPKPYHGEDIDDNKLKWSLKYSEFIAPMVLEIQRLMDRVDKLESEIKTLKDMVDKLESEIKTLK